MSPFTLDPFQQAAIEHTQQGFSVIVSAPTGSGKTLIAERVIDRCMKQGNGVIYTAPIKALSNQKYRDFSKQYPNKVGIVTGDVNINPHAPIVIMTTEIFRNAILTDSQRFNDKTWLILDEIHYLDDAQRGTVWEETLILLPKHIRFVALSATISNIDEFSAWLNAIHGQTVKKVVETHRPVPLEFYFQCDNKIYRSTKELKGLLGKRMPKRSKTITHTKPNKLHTLITHLENEKSLPCIFFSFSRRRCEDLSGELYNYDFLTASEKEEIVELTHRLAGKLDVAHDAHLGHLLPLIKRGIAYHHAGLLPTLKEIIERLFTTGLIKLIFTTETFALGINMPAKTVVFDTLTKYYGRYHNYLRTRDFYQMAGRAGRRGIDTKGFVYSKVNPFRIDLSALEKILFGRYEPITSQLRSCYATILNLYKIMGNKLYDIYPDSFHFQQGSHLEKKEALGLLKRKVSLLKELNYIRDGEITAKAHLASSVYSFELQTGELFEAGFLENVDAPSLFILVLALVYEPRKGEGKPRLSKKSKKLKKQTKTVIKKIHGIERKFRIYPLSKKFHFNMSEAALAWYNGSSFSKLSRYTDTDEGEIVRYFRMAIQVLREMRTSGATTDKLKTTIDTCIQRVHRDVVDAYKQLNQIL